MTQETLYWLFSTVAQTYGAIVGILGMLVVYKLQHLSTTIIELRQDYKDTIRFFFAMQSINMSDNHLVISWDQISDARESTPEKNEMDDLITTLKPLLHKSNEIRREFKIFILPHLLLIILSILSLLVCDYLATLNAGATAVILVTVFSMSFLMIVSFCFLLIKE